MGREGGKQRKKKKREEEGGEEIFWRKRKKKRREREGSVKNRGIGDEGFDPFYFIFVGVTDLNILMLNS